VKLQSGNVPLLPAVDSDGVRVNFASAKATRTVDSIFAQAPYFVRSKILLEGELDSLLSFLVEQYMDKVSRAQSYICNI
jgi:hypothetical protein